MAMTIVGIEKYFIIMAICDVLGNNLLVYNVILDSK